MGTAGCCYNVLLPSELSTFTKKLLTESVAVYEAVAPKPGDNLTHLLFFLSEMVSVVLGQQALDPGFSQPLLPASSSANASADFGLQ